MVENLSRRDALKALGAMSLLPGNFTGCGGGSKDMEKKEMAVFLLIGQSNMAGRGRPGEVQPLGHRDIYMFRDNRWIKAAEPLHDDRPDIAGVGLGMSFAMKLVESGKVPSVGLVPCAVGGTKLNRWEPGADLYERAVSVTSSALSEGVLKGILWHQGEGDSFTREDALSYGARLENMILGLRERLSAENVPVITGELGQFLYNRRNMNFFETVNMQLKSLEQVIPAYACADALGLTDIGDNLHFDARSLRKFGLRYAEKYIEITEN